MAFQGIESAAKEIKHKMGLSVTGLGSHLSPEVKEGLPVVTLSWTLNDRKKAEERAGQAEVTSSAQGQDRIGGSRSHETKVAQKVHWGSGGTGWNRIGASQATQAMGSGL